MGTCCSAHLTTKARAYASDAENGAVTVKPLDVNPHKCDYCQAPAEFTVSYFPKSTANTTDVTITGTYQKWIIR